MSAAPPPGAPSRSPELSAQLAAALAAKGAAYRPRTHHLVDGAPKYTNRLIGETSPYLLQHAHNPVDWRPWGDEAFAEAARLDRPVFLSIGYSTCHWCHVMEGESFEDHEIAHALNERFICIKVDREERPDVDAVYMTAVQALTGQGGWPMSVWLTPARAPFFAGTYFPPRDGARGARRGFLTLLGDIATTWAHDRQRIDGATESLTNAVKAHMEGPPASGGDLPGVAAIQTCIEQCAHAFDPEHGGLRRAPKFPSNVPVRLLLRHHRRTGDLRPLQIAALTLEKMAGGGLYDQLGGGFHRYSTDERWLVPHFEKMLYDNAVLVVAYTEAYQVTRRTDFARVVRETLDYVLREMTAPDGGFYSATDADSDGEEGRFFVWTAAEVRARLGADADRFMRHYDVREGGNWEGVNVLNVPEPDEDEWAALARARAVLYEARSHRPAPLRDDKILAAWNGLMISAFAFAGFVLDELRYVDAASRAADFVLTEMSSRDRLARSFRPGPVTPNGFLEDHAFVAAGLLDLYEATFEKRWLDVALALSRTLQTHFADDVRGGWFGSASDAERLIAREKPAYDGAEPSGTSVATMNALRLATFTGDEAWRHVAERALRSIAPVLHDRPMAMTEALLAVDFLTDSPREVVILADAPDPAAARAVAKPMLDVVRGTFLPNRVLLGGPPGLPAANLPALADRAPLSGQPTAFVCEQGRCELPTTEPAALAKQLVVARSYSDQ